MRCCTMSSQLELPAHVLTPLWPESVFCVPLRISWFAMAAGYQRLADVQAVLVISQPWSDMIRSGFKTMELRSSSFRKYEGQWIGLATSSIEMALCRIKHRACSSPCRPNPTQSSTTIEVQSKWRCAELNSFQPRPGATRPHTKFNNNRGSTEMALCRVKHRAGSSPCRPMPGVGWCSGRIGPARSSTEPKEYQL